MDKITVVIKYKNGLYSWRALEEGELFTQQKTYDSFSISLTLNNIDNTSEVVRIEVFKGDYQIYTIIRENS